MCENQAIKIITKGGSGEIVEKKSRFICTVRPVKEESEVRDFFAEIKKKYWDAKHNCTAAVIGDNNEFARCSDDGEPSGTAGRPMLEVLINEGYHNVAVVVTRYFGGVLLGTGGLVRAYQGAVKAGLAACECKVKTRGYKYLITVSYNDYNKLNTYIATHNIIVADSEYADSIKLTVILKNDERDSVIKDFVDATSGRAVVEDLGETDIEMNI